MLNVTGKNESMEPVASLTNSPWSREYLVDGTFTGDVTGGGSTKLAGGTLEAGYQIGCGIIQDDIESITTVGITPGVGIPLVNGTLFPITLGLSLSEQIKIDLKPGTVNIVPVGKKSFKGTKLSRLDHRLPHQDRRLRRPVVHPVVRDADELDRQHRRRRDLPRRHQGRLAISHRRSQSAARHRRGSEQPIRTRDPSPIGTHHHFSGEIPVTDERRRQDMLNRFATVAAVCMLIPTGSDPARVGRPAPIRRHRRSLTLALAPTAAGQRRRRLRSSGHRQDPRRPDADGRRQGRDPASGRTADDVAVVARLAGRRHVHRHHTGSVAGGTLEAGYQIGCGVEMDKIKLNGSIGATLGNGSLTTTGVSICPAAISFPIQGQVEVEPRPGTITNVVVDKKTFKGTSSRITLKDIHIKVDNCVGASSLRSYAVLTSSGTDADDIVAYYGVTKVF